MLKCSKCGQEKNKCEFDKRSSTKRGYKSQCKQCRSINEYKKNKEVILEKRSMHYKENKIEIDLKNKQYREENYDKIQLQKQKYRSENKDKVRHLKRESYQRNKDKKSNKDTAYKNQKRYREKNRVKLNNANRNRYASDFEYRIKNIIRSRFVCAIKNDFKAGSAVDGLGCTIEFLKGYIEKLFKPGMHWGNWGRHGWHIDHIIPLASFDLTDRDQLLKACHYTNLQPLWAADNLSKGAKMPGTY